MSSMICTQPNVPHEKNIPINFTWKFFHMKFTWKFSHVHSYYPMHSLRDTKRHQTENQSFICYKIYHLRFNFSYIQFLFYICITLLHGLKNTISTLFHTTLLLKHLAKHVMMLMHVQHTAGMEQLWIVTNQICYKFVTSEICYIHLTYDMP
jgi:hypothetical protein